MSRGKYCRRKNNEKSRLFVIHQNVDERCKSHHHANSHINNYVVHSRIGKNHKKNYERFIYSHARKNVLEDCITDSEREALIRFGEYRIGPEPGSSYSANDEVQKCGDDTNLGPGSPLTDEQIKTILEQATALCALIRFAALIGIILSLE